MATGDEVDPFLALALRTLCLAKPESLDRAMVLALKEAIVGYFERCALASAGCVHPEDRRTYLSGRRFDERRVTARFVCDDCGATTETLLPSDSTMGGWLVGDRDGA